MSVVVPFAGGRQDAEELLEGLSRLRLEPGDELIVADNSPAQILQRVSPVADVRVVAATGEGSPARARNAGAAAARGSWILFLDSDCRPAADLLERYFERPIPERCGIVAGRVDSDPDQTSVAAEFAATRGFLEQRFALRDGFKPWVMTANVLVRTKLWRSLGGFLEGIFNGEDVDFCWRAQSAGWTIELNSAAAVEHHHRETVRGLLRQAAVRRASAHWVHRRWPDARLPPLHVTRVLLRSAATVPVFLAFRQPRRAALKALDAAVELAMLRAKLGDNRAKEWPAAVTGRRPLQIWCDEFPEVSQTFVTAEARQLAALGHAVEVLGVRRPDRPSLEGGGIRARWLEDDTPGQRLASLAVLALRHPRACVRDWVDRRPWRAEEPVPPLRYLAPAARRIDQRRDLILHAHFAGGAALAAMRVARITRLPWTLTAHAYDIYRSPANLRTKLRDAAFVTSGCDYTVRDLRRIAGRDDDVVRVVMGVDPDRFRRTSPRPGTGTVVGVGRLVEKKGFIHLVRAAADPRLEPVLERVVIAGDGPERDALEEEARALGITDRIELIGRADADEVKELLEGADVLAMPCVVARDGDRDSMPVVVKEALAMEVPVAVSDEVGLPELVRPEFGRCVPPADPAALAAALAELLELPPERRAEMGKAGREFVARHASVRAETERLSELFGRLPAGRT